MAIEFFARAIKKIEENPDAKYLLTLRVKAYYYSALSKQELLYDFETIMNDFCKAYEISKKFISRNEELLIYILQFVKN